jgi:membrane-bound metal-dependent hydrolase YbcI (DUF457 family)
MYTSIDGTDQGGAPRRPPTRVGRLGRTRTIESAGVDNLTHSLFGWTLARAGVGRGVPYATATLILASNAPDADVVTAMAGGVEYLAAHRGPTHGPIGVIGLGLAVAALVTVWHRWRGLRGQAAAGDTPAASVFRRSWLLAMAGVVGHVLMDLPTVYATRLLSPFSGAWYAFDWMPIIDVYLWLVLIGAVIAGRATGRRRQAALVALSLMACDYAGRALLHQRALAQGAAFDASGVHAPCATAPTFVVHPSARAPAAGPASPGTCQVAAALPTFTSPFTWRIVRQHTDGYEISERGGRGAAGPTRTTRIAIDTGPEVARVHATRAGQVYFDFARFPIARLGAHTAAGTTIHLFDARFVGLPLDTRTEALPRTLAMDVTVAAQP